MNNRDLIIQEIDKIPDALLQEVLDFMQFIRAKHQQDELETMLLSESFLAKDWLNPSEETAWQDL
jgi:Protein of unknown function (DUF2281)